MTVSEHQHLDVATPSVHNAIGQHAFMRDEGARYDPELALTCYGLVIGLFRSRLCGGART
jgi:hypothetical protein